MGRLKILLHYYNKQGIDWRKLNINNAKFFIQDVSRIEKKALEKLKNAMEKAGN